jgi:hypothetical protein
VHFQLPQRFSRPYDMSADERILDFAGGRFFQPFGFMFHMSPYSSFSFPFPLLFSISQPREGNQGIS